MGKRRPHRCRERESHERLAKSPHETLPVCHPLAMRLVAWSAWLAAGWLAACSPEPSKSPRNLLVIVLDTLRPDHLSCYGYERDTSPHLDAYAQDCFLFDAAQSSAPWTAPSLISLMTSLHPDAHGVLDNKALTALPDDVDTLAEILERSGYATGAFTEGGYAKQSFGLGQGFAVYPTNPGDEVSYTSNTAFPSRLESNLDRLLAWLEARPEGEPFFGFFQTYEPHAPFRAPARFVRRYESEYDEALEHEECASAIERWNAERELAEAGLRLLQRHLLHCSFQGMPRIERAQELIDYGQEWGVQLSRSKLAEDPGLVAWVRNLYDAEIAFTDHELQRLWKALVANRQSDNTLVVIVSDHGEGLGEHGHLEHGRVLYEEVLHVVFLLRVPFGGFEPRRTSYPARTIDVLPTVLELLDVPLGRTRPQGESLVRVLRGEEDSPPPSFSHVRAWGANAHSVRDGNWRLIVDHETGTTELYDLSTDPDESIDRAQARPEIARRMLQVLENQRALDAALHEQLRAGEVRAIIDSSTLHDLEGLGYGGMGDDGSPED